MRESRYSFGGGGALRGAVEDEDQGGGIAGGVAGGNVEDVAASAPVELHGLGFAADCRGAGAMGCAGEEDND